MSSLSATPKQPWSEYQVHDTTRPQPVQVKTAGAVVTPPPADAIVLFDGKSTDAFTKAWSVKDGVMTVTGEDTRTKKSFGSCQLHLEWRIPADRKITGQTGGNSGVFLMDRYEIQVLESHSHPSYADGQAGAVYGQTPPLVNATAPQGEWQSYDIIFNAPVYGEKGMILPATITVIHNGVLLHHNQVIHGPTVWSQVASYPDEHPAKAPLRLQFHGDPVDYRNIWIRDLEKK